MIACSLTFTEIEKDWEWLHRNLSDTLNSFDNEEDVTEFVCCKIQSVIANSVPDNQGIDGMLCIIYISVLYSVCYFISLSTVYAPHSLMV